MNIKNIVYTLKLIDTLIVSSIYDAEAMREFEPDKNWPNQETQSRAIKQAINLLEKLDKFSNAITYFNSNKEV